MQISFMHINLEWWSNVPMVLSVGYILNILLIILRVDFFHSWTVELILLTELCLPPYETKAFALALSVSFRNHNLTKLEQSVTVDFYFEIIIHICLIVF